MGLGGRRHAPAALPQVRNGVNCTGDRVGPTAGLDRYEKSLSASTGFRTPVRPACSELLSRPTMLISTAGNTSCNKLLHVSFQQDKSSIGI